TALFFASVLIHELSHAFVARMEGLRIQDIQLHIFGGWARLIGEPPTPMAELRIAIAGPVSSFLLAIFFWLWLLVVESLSGGAKERPTRLRRLSLPGRGQSLPGDVQPVAGVATGRRKSAARDPLAAA